MIFIAHVIDVVVALCIQLTSQLCSYKLMDDGIHVVGLNVISTADCTSVQTFVDSVIMLKKS